MIAVWRNKAKEKKRKEGQKVEEKEPDCLLICDKQRNGDWEGQIALWFDEGSKQFLPNPGQRPVEIFALGGGGM